MEEEIKTGEREREGLRVETQRLRDELGDLKVESEIRLEKLRRAEATIESLRSRKPSTLAVESLRTRSPGSEVSVVTPTSPTASTPPPRSDSASDAPTPPSPPLSDAPANVKLETKTPVSAKRRSFVPDASATPRPSLYGARTLSRHTRGPSLAAGSISSVSDAKSAKPSWPRTSFQPTVMARSESLNQMKSLRSRMQKIEERVHSARSKLPPHSTPRSSPRTGSGASMPSSVTLRRTSKRPSAISASITSNTGSEDSFPLSSRRESHVKRLSYGIPRPASTAPGERPPSSLASDRPSSTSSYQRPSSRIGSARPGSRSGADTPLSGNFRDIPAPSTTFTHRPRSSIGGPSYGSLHSSTGPVSPHKSLHRSAQSISEHTRRQQPEGDDPAARRVSGLPPPGHVRKQSLQMRPPPPLAPRPPSRKAVEAHDDDLGETY